MASILGASSTAILASRSLSSPTSKPTLASFSFTSGAFLNLLLFTLRNMSLSSHSFKVCLLFECGQVFYPLFFLGIFNCVISVISGFLNCLIVLPFFISCRAGLWEEVFWRNWD